MYLRGNNYLNYLGGKARIAKHIVPVIQSYINGSTDLYVEPFCGACSILVKVDHNRKVAGDSHKELIALYKALQNGWVPPSVVSEELYRECKEGQHEEFLRGFVGFACSFSGKWFGGYARNKTGRNYAAEGRRSLLKKLEELKKTKFLNKDYTHFKTLKNSVIYCDPPYANVTSYKNTKINYEQFYSWCEMLSENNTVLISEYNMPSQFECILEVNRNLEMHSSNRKRVEKLFKFK